MFRYIKNLILDNISNNIEEMILEQGNEKNKFEESINNWKEGYQNKDFNLMEKEIKSISEDGSLDTYEKSNKIIKTISIYENIYCIFFNSGVFESISVLLNNNSKLLMVIVFLIRK